MGGNGVGIQIKELAPRIIKYLQATRDMHMMMMADWWLGSAGARLPADRVILCLNFPDTRYSVAMTTSCQKSSKYRAG